jgi:hypothetical protein
MKKPNKITKNMVLCAKCKKPIHIDDLALISKEGMYHKKCAFELFLQNPDGFLITEEPHIKSQFYNICKNCGEKYPFITKKCKKYKNEK